MKFSINSDELGRNVQGLAKVASGKSLAILDHFLFEADGELLHVTASDGENMMRTTMHIDSLSMTEDEKERIFCIHNATIGDFLRNIPAQPITFDLDFGNNMVTVSYKNGHVLFPFSLGDGFPVFSIKDDLTEMISLSSEVLLRDIADTSPFVGQETLRPIMNAICFNYGTENLDVVGCNGGMMMKISHHGIRSENESTMLLPPKPASLLKYFLSKETKETRVRLSDNAAVFECGCWQLSCTLTTGRYPNYNSVIPKAHSIEALVDKRDLQNAIRRMLPMGESHMKTVKMMFSASALSISSEDPDFQKSAREELPCETTGDGLCIGVNGESMLNMLQHVPSDTVRLKMTEPTRPILIEPDVPNDNEEITGLVMPTLLND